MGNLSKHFDREEFACKCGECRAIAVDKALIDVLENVRTTFNQPVTITSGYRCPMHNLKVGGSRNSWHLTGKAADIVVANVSARDVSSFLKNEYASQYGIGTYDDFTHIDVRDVKARW